MTKETKMGLYRHYARGEHYQVIAVAAHTETQEPYVVYQQLYGEYGFCVRLQEEFMAEVTVDGKTQPRFQYLGPIGQVPPKK